MNSQLGKVRSYEKILILKSDFKLEDFVYTTFMNHLEHFEFYLLV